MPACPQTFSPLQHDKTAARTHVLSAVKELLESGCRREAVRLFLSLASSSATPPGPDLLNWAVCLLGRRLTGRLIGATASYRCFNCSGGYTACEDCGGKGLVSGEVCSKCLATGLCPCDFCNASGYIAVNLIPAELRLGVMEIRLKRAMAEAAPLLENPPPHSAAQNWRDRGRLLLKLNRLMGVAENGVTAAAQFIARDDENSHAVDQLVLGCNDLGSKIRQRMRDVLACLSDEQSMRGQFYRALAGHRSTGSWLDHSRIETPAGIEPSR